MVALALLIAESEPSRKDLMIRPVLSLLCDETTGSTAGALDRSSSKP